MGYAFVAASSHKIDFGDIADGWGTAKISISVWVKLSAWNQTGGFVGKRDSAGTNNSYGFFMDPGTVTFQAVGFNWQWSTSGFPTDEWVSLVATWDHAGADPKVRLYMNGTPVTASGTGGDGSVITNTSSTLKVGLLNASSWYLNGSIAEVAVWNIGLTEEDAEALAAGTRPSGIESEALEFYASLEEDAVDTITSTAGTVTGATLTDHPTMLDDDGGSIGGLASSRHFSTKPFAPFSGI